MYMTWEYQKELQEKPIQTMSEMKDFIRAIPDDRDRALVTLCYLTAGRISEVLELKGINLIPETVNNRPILLVKNMANRKNRKRHFKNLPIPLDKEGEFWDIIKGYVETGIKEMRIFTITPTRAWQILKKYDINPHFLRHIRLTHLVTYYDFNEALLIRFAGWTDGRPARHYMEIKWKDLLQKM